MKTWQEILPALLATAALTVSSGASADDDPSTYRSHRIAYEVVGGSIATAVGGTGTLMLCASGGGGGGGQVSGGAIASALAICGAFGGLMFQNVGVYAAGRWSGGNGSYLATLGGELAGVALALGPLAMAGWWDKSSEWRRKNKGTLKLIHSLVLPMAGGILGYELSTHRVSDTGSSTQGLASPPMVTYGGVF